jgi:Tol biopolymer transport system component
MWSSDGILLAFERQITEPVEGGINTSTEIWIFELDSGNLRTLSSDLRISTTAWRPGTHILAYTSWLDDNYFSARGQVDSTKAIGVWGIDADSGESLELVPPENGYSLSWIKWSPDGRYLLFHEVLYYEGAGAFAYYDLETGTYTATQEIIGSTDLSPNNQTLAYDSLTYVATGGEGIFLRPLEGGEPQQFSPDYELGYAFHPLFSPNGDEIAYLAEIGSLETGQYTVVIQALDGGEPLPLGTYESAFNLAWLPDASGLVLSAGPYENSQVLEVSVLDGTSRVLAEGRDPAPQPVQP